jgi:translation initiation factor 2-alpha kinase 3
LKIGDFGLATDINKELKEQVGTPLYQSPEQIDGLPYDEKVDIWSLGLIFLELCYLFKTKQEKREIFLNIRIHTKYPKRIKEKYLHEYRLIKHMTSRNPNERMSAEDILNSFEYKYLKEKFSKVESDE